jgi:hypothetical protein
MESSRINSGDGAPWREVRPEGGTVGEGVDGLLILAQLSFFAYHPNPFDYRVKVLMEFFRRKPDRSYLGLSKVCISSIIASLLMLWAIDLNTEF